MDVLSVPRLQPAKPRRAPWLTSSFGRLPSPVDRGDPTGTCVLAPIASKVTDLTARRVVPDGTIAGAFLGLCPFTEQRERQPDPFVAVSERNEERCGIASARGPYVVLPGGGLTGEVQYS